ncbi:MAG: AAA family ATPase [Alphaproteobacteria bacterium]
MAITERDIFDKIRIPAELDEALRRSNPWWSGLPGRVVPGFRRHAFGSLLRRMDHGLAPIVVVRGPRQVGKTTLQEQIIRELIEVRGVEPHHILRVQFDELPSFRGLKQPLLTVAYWFENRVLGQTFNEAAHAGRPAYLFFDEVQNQADWAPQLKYLVDHHTVHVMVTGSSALRIEIGRDSLAGRITSVDLGTLTLREIAELAVGVRVDPLLPGNGLEALRSIDFWRNLIDYGRTHGRARQQAFVAFSDRGGYPIAHARPDVPWLELANQLNETVIRRVIQHDLRMGERGRKRDQGLLEEVFRLACRYAGQAPSSALYVAELSQTLRANVGWQRVLHYLRFLDGALLLRLIEPAEIRLKRRRGGPKICLVDHSLRASWLAERIPLDRRSLDEMPHLTDLAGRIAESVVGAFLAGLPHSNTSYFPERAQEPEVDFVLTVGENRIPIEVKYRRRIDPHGDTVGLRSFVERSVYNAPFGILVTQEDDVVLRDPRLLAVPLSTLLMMS